MLKEMLKGKCEGKTKKKIQKYKTKKMFPA